MAEPELTLARRPEAASIASMSRRFIEAGLDPSWTESRVLRAIDRADTNVVVARQGRDIAGFAIMQFGETRAHLNLLAVATGWRRTGVGRRLVEWQEASARVAGTFTVELECRVGNVGAIRFYRALGYRETGVLSRYYQGEEDAVRMRRDLALVAPA